MAKIAEKPKRRELTFKEQKLVQGVAMGKSQRQAALEAYDVKNPETASAVASEALSKPNVRQALNDALERHGITIDKIIKPVADALEADRVMIVGKKVYKTPDHAIRLNASRTAAKFAGLEDNEGGTNIIFANIVNDHSTKYGI